MPLVKEYETERREIRKTSNNEEREWEMKAAGHEGGHEGGHWYSDSAPRLLLVSVNASWERKNGTIGIGSFPTKFPKKGREQN